MKILLSPAKSQDFSATIKSPLPDTTIIFKKEVEQLYRILSNKTVVELIDLAKVSKQKATENYHNYKEKNVFGQALLAYNGIVFKSMNLATWGKEDFLYAQGNTFICSALYGLLRTTDCIKPYRLDMSYKLLKDESLTAFWKQKWNDFLTDEDVLINLASKEFSKLLVHPNMITIEFADFKDNQYKKINTYVKMARGKFYQALIKQKAVSNVEIKKIVIDNYCYNEELSLEKEWYFTR